MVRVALRVLEDGDLTHVLATAVGGARGVVVLDATVRADGVLYARTDLLRVLGLGGGRYESVREAR